MFKKYKLLPAVIILILTILIGCSGGKMEEQTEKKISYNSLQDIPDEAWKKLAQKKIYFGHQSVGLNIIYGIKDLMKENPQIKLNITESADKSDFKAGVFAHSKIGQNKDPKSKIEEFVKIMDSGIGNSADVAFLKFCYVDVKAGTDINKVFNEYKNATADLKEQFPQTTFIHLSVPLKAILKSTWKTWIKGILGKDVDLGHDDNIKRNEINKLFEMEYQAGKQFFNIAEIESTFPDGTRSTFEKDGKSYYAMVPTYTDDSGHLNEIGRKKVAEQLLLILVNQN
jgi:hypothetical protein